MAQVSRKEWLAAVDEVAGIEKEVEEILAKQVEAEKQEQLEFEEKWAERYED